jgi:DNA-binding transcriptional LysR family regulator
VIFARKSEKIFAEKGLEFHALLNCPIYVYLAKSHPLAKQDIITLQELQDYPCLSFDQGNNNSFYFAEEVLSTYEYKQLIKANDKYKTNNNRYFYDVVARRIVSIEVVDTQ